MGYDFPYQDSTNSDFPPEVVCSPDRRILADWQNSAYEMFVWRRPDFNVIPYQRYIDSVNSDYMHDLNGFVCELTLGNDGQISALPPFAAKWNIAYQIGLHSCARVPFRKLRLFPDDTEQILLQDIATRFEQDLPLAFPGKSEFKVKIWTITKPEEIAFHTDRLTIMGYNYSTFSTQYAPWDAVLPSVQRGPETREISQRNIQMDKVQELHPGDISIIRSLPHRGFASQTPSHRFWIGVAPT